LRLTSEAESAVAAGLIALGLFNCIFGLRFAKPLFMVSAFAGTAIGAMYPIDSVLGDIICGEYRCAAGQPAEEFCGWAMVRPACSFN
jgi:hypothetical protein